MEDCCAASTYITLNSVDAFLMGLVALASFTQMSCSWCRGRHTDINPHIHKHLHTHSFSLSFSLFPSPLSHTHSADIIASRASFVFCFCFFKQQTNKKACISWIDYAPEPGEREDLRDSKQCDQPFGIYFTLGKMFIWSLPYSCFHCHFVTLNQTV